MIDRAWILMSKNDKDKIVDIRQTLEDLSSDEFDYFMKLIFEEISVNIFSHGFPEEWNKNPWLHFCVNSEPEGGPYSYRMTFIDNGIPFDPLEYKGKGNNKSIGGHGIGLVKKCSKKIEYEYKGGLNVLTVFV